MKKALGALLRGRRFLDWRESTRFARALDSALDSLAAACVTQPEQGRELCEFMLEKLFARYEHADDSSGAIGSRLHALAELYRRTLERQPAPDDAAHGRRFLKLTRRDDWNVLDLAVFWPLLGPRAQEGYAAAVEAEYASLGKPSKDNWSRDFAVVHRMEALVVARGDVDLLIRVLARDLSSGHAYERIVLVCREAGREREATSWAERGYRHHPHWRGMRALLAERYRRDGLDDKALELRWEDFRANPTPNGWHGLKTDAADQWPTYRERALAHVEQSEATRDGRRDVSVRVALLVADGDTDAARRLAEQHTVSIGLLDTLAAAVAQTHPVSAAAFLRRSVDATLPHLDARRYADAVQRIAHVRRLAPGADTDTWIGELRARYRARRKLMALLDEID